MGSQFSVWGYSLSGLWLQSLSTQLIMHTLLNVLSTLNLNFSIYISLSLSHNPFVLSFVLWLKDTYIRDTRHLYKLYSHTILSNISFHYLNTYPFNTYSLFLEQHLILLQLPSTSLWNYESTKMQNFHLDHDFTLRIL